MMMKKSIVQPITRTPDKSQAAPEIKVDLKPNIEVTVPPVDMAPIAEAIKQMMAARHEAKEDKEEEESEGPEKPKQVKIEVERDGRGFIKTLICTEINDG